jgi:hypothetical protein
VFSPFVEQWKVIITLTQQAPSGIISLGFREFQPVPLPPVKIQQTVIEPSRVTLVLADQPELEHASVIIKISVPNQSARERPLAIIQAEALRIARDRVISEIREIEGLATQNQERFFQSDFVEPGQELPTILLPNATRR